MRKLGIVEKLTFAESKPILRETIAAAKLVYFKAASKTIMLYNVVTHKVERRDYPQLKRKFSRDAEWLLLDSDTLFVCGGKALSQSGNPLTFYFTFSTG